MCINIPHGAFFIMLQPLQNIVSCRHIFKKNFLRALYSCRVVVVGNVEMKLERISRNQTSFHSGFFFLTDNITNHTHTRIEILYLRNDFRVFCFQIWAKTTKNAGF
jgi:hypothetical protein